MLLHLGQTLGALVWYMSFGGSVCSPQAVPGCSNPVLQVGGAFYVICMLGGSVLGNPEDLAGK